MDIFADVSRGVDRRAADTRILNGPRLQSAKALEYQPLSSLDKVSSGKVIGMLRFSWQCRPRNGNAKYTWNEFIAISAFPLAQDELVLMKIQLRQTGVHATDNLS